MATVLQQRVALYGMHFRKRARLLFDRDKPRNLDLGIWTSSLDYQLNSLSLRLFKPFFDNVLLEHGGLPNVLPLPVHLDFFGWAVRGGNSKSLLG